MSLVNREFLIPQGKLMLNKIERLDGIELLFCKRNKEVFIHQAFDHGSR